jgi:large subunit ribosomal protein L5
MSIVQEKELNILKAIGEKFGYTNRLQGPRLTKVVLNTGVGKISDKNKINLIQDRLARITGQKAAPRPAKKSIASFKLRQGDIVGYQVSLHGKRMYGFLDKLIHIALPRTKDFRGLSRSIVDDMGNLTIGIKEHTIFPETSDEDISDIFGLSITLVTTARNREEALAFFEEIGIPFKKEE